MRLRILALFILAAAGGCGPGSPGASAREPDEYLGCATDESWRSFDDRELTGLITLDDAQAPSFAVPTEGATLPSAVKPTLSWQLSSTVVGKSGGDAACTACPTCGSLVPEHQPPVTGNVYDLQFSIDGVMVWRALTTLQTWSPTDAAWKLMIGKTVKLRPTRMQLKINDIQSGPFQPTKSITFSVGS